MTPLPALEATPGADGCAAEIPGDPAADRQRGERRSDLYHTVKTGAERPCFLQYKTDSCYMGFRFLLSRSTIQAIRLSRPSAVFASKYARV